MISLIPSQLEIIEKSKNTPTQKQILLDYWEICTNRFRIWIIRRSKICLKIFSMFIAFLFVCLLFCYLINYPSIYRLFVFLFDAYICAHTVYNIYKYIDAMLSNLIMATQHENFILNISSNFYTIFETWSLFNINTPGNKFV